MNPTVIVVLDSRAYSKHTPTRLRVAIGVTGPGICCIAVFDSFLERDTEREIIIDVEPEPMEVVA
jgi:cephalosporin hydroxylase